MSTGQSEWILPFHNSYTVILMWWVLAEYRLVLIPGSNLVPKHYRAPLPIPVFSVTLKTAPQTHFIDLSRNSGFSLKAELGPGA